jgi:hypothetical protein
MRWRARFVRWNFEPYGVAIDIDYARSVGIRPVVYGTVRAYARLPERDRPFFQNVGEKGGDWTPENEWRFHGSLSLAAIPSNKLRIIVRRESEIDAVQGLTRSQVIALTREAD